MIIFEGEVGVVHRAEPEDCSPVSVHMRASDVLELRDGTGSDPITALVDSFAKSSLCGTIKIGEEPVAMFGVAPDKAVPGFGFVWYLATDRWDREGRRDMLRFSPHFINTMQDGFDHIGNFIDARNKKSIKWLKHLGFTRDVEIRSTASGLPFVFMVRRNPGV